MRSFDYKCENCNYLEEKIFAAKETSLDVYQCPNCNKDELRRIWVAPKFTIKGLSSKNSYGLHPQKKLDKGERKEEGAKRREDMKKTDDPHHRVTKFKDILKEKQEKRGIRNGKGKIKDSFQ